MTSPFGRHSGTGWTTMSPHAASPFLVGAGAGEVVTEDYGILGGESESQQDPLSLASIYDYQSDCDEDDEDEWSGVGSFSKKDRRSLNHSKTASTNFKTKGQKGSGKKGGKKSTPIYKSKTGHSSFWDLPEPPHNARDAYEKFQSMGWAHKALVLKVIMFTCMFVLMLGLIAGRDVQEEVEQLEQSDYLKSSIDDNSESVAPWDEPVEKTGENQVHPQVHPQQVVAPWEEPKEEVPAQNISSLLLGEKVIADELKKQAAPLTTNPLPEGWTEYTDLESGRSYFSNNVDGKTQWDRPIENDDDELPLPEGWKKTMDPETGEIFYYDVNGKTTWERPTEAVQPTSNSNSNSHSNSNSNSYDEGKEEATTTSATKSLDSSQPDSSNTDDNPPLPTHWKAVVDKKTGKTFYRNKKTGTKTWTRPSPSEPNKSLRGSASEENDNASKNTSKEVPAKTTSPATATAGSKSFEGSNSGEAGASSDEETSVMAEDNSDEEDVLEIESNSREEAGSSDEDNPSANEGTSEEEPKAPAESQSLESQSKDEPSSSEEESPDMDEDTSEEEEARAPESQSWKNP